MSRFSAKIAVDPKGYEWTGAEDMDESSWEYQRRRTLVWKSADTIRRFRGEEETWPNFYDPFVTEPALFRIFASLEHSEDAILDFAARYGDLVNIYGAIESVFDSLDR